MKSYPLMVGYLHGVWAKESYVESNFFVLPWDRGMYLIGHLAGRAKRRRLNF